MRNRFIPSKCFTLTLIFVALIGCGSTKNRTEERAKERVFQFLRLMTEDRMEEAEKLLSRELSRSETKELFLDGYDNRELKDTSIVINVTDVTFHVKGDKNKAVVSVIVRNEKIGFTKMATVPVKFEKGDWYIGG
ncbi:MAG: hypothetical protein ACE5K2_09175 [Candidatus Zixiibacteriota bacterium]